MVSLETTRMIVAPAAGSDMPLFLTDFFLNADLDHPHLYCGLPTLPPEMWGGKFGMGGAQRRPTCIRPVTVSPKDPGVGNST